MSVRDFRADTFPAKDAFLLGEEPAYPVRCPACDSHMWGGRCGPCDTAAWVDGFMAGEVEFIPDPLPEVPW